MTKWTANDLGDQAGKTFLVTGANTGIGYQAALELARHGADVTLACRSEERGEAAAKRIEAETRVRPAVAQLDLGDLDNVRGFPDRVGDVDVLINNAGIMVPPFGRTPQGFETQWGVNVVGHFALTALLWPRISPHGRVVTISSIAHKNGHIDFDNLRGEKRYEGWREYQQSKLGNLVMTLELQRRITDERLSIGAHPGVSHTDLVRSMNPIARLGVRFMPRASMGALPTLYAATMDLPGGAYIGPQGWRETRGYPGPARIKSRAKDEQLGKRLWAELETASGLTFDPAV